jgi:hypothetical protein
MQTAAQLRQKLQAIFDYQDSNIILGLIVNSKWVHEFTKPERAYGIRL